jgi:hypothetical protein
MNYVYEKLRLRVCTYIERLVSCVSLKVALIRPSLAPAPRAAHQEGDNGILEYSIKQTVFYFAESDDQVVVAQFLPLSRYVRCTGIIYECFVLNRNVVHTTTFLLVNMPTYQVCRHITRRIGVYSIIILWLSDSLDGPAYSRICTYLIVLYRYTVW